MKGLQQLLLIARTWAPKNMMLMYLKLKETTYGDRETIHFKKFAICKRQKPFVALLVDRGRDEHGGKIELPRAPTDSEDDDDED